MKLLNNDLSFYFFLPSKNGWYIPNDKVPVHPQLRAPLHIMQELTDAVGTETTINNLSP